VANECYSRNTLCTLNLLYIVCYFDWSRAISDYHYKSHEFPPPIKLIATIWLKYCWKWRWTPRLEALIDQSHFLLITIDKGFLRKYINYYKVLLSRYITLVIRFTTDNCTQKHIRLVNPLTKPIIWQSQFTLALHFMPQFSYVKWIQIKTAWSKEAKKKT
jgi:hypothetical protein